MLAEALNIPPQLAALIDVKRFATAQAHAAWFHGVRVEAIEGDDGVPVFVASLHALTRTFDRLETLEAWLRKLDAEDAPRGEVARFVEGLPA